jgi:hypothetical protein
MSRTLELVDKELPDPSKSKLSGSRRRAVGAHG